MSDRPPKFWALFAEALRLSADKRSIFAFVPWWLSFCLAAPIAVVYFGSNILRSHISDNNAVAVFASIAVVGGFFGSVSIATMGQVQKMASEYPFSGYLREQGLFDLFLFWPQFTLLTQILLILLSISAAVFLRLVNFDQFNAYVIAMDFGLLLYVCTKTWNLVELIRQLTWHYEEYQRLLAQARAAKELHTEC